MSTMKHRISSLLFAVCVAGLLAGCGPGGGEVRPANSGPVQGTLGLENMTPEQKIQKIQNDNSIPEQYKQTYINSVRAQSGGGAPK